MLFGFALCAVGILVVAAAALKVVVLSATALVIGIVGIVAYWVWIIRQAGDAAKSKLTAPAGETFDLTGLTPDKDFRFALSHDGKTGAIRFDDFSFAHVKPGDYFVLPNGTRSARYQVISTDGPLFFGRWVEFEIEFAPRTEAPDTAGLPLPL